MLLQTTALKPKAMTKLAGNVAENLRPGETTCGEEKSEKIDEPGRRWVIFFWVCVCKL